MSQLPIDPKSLLAGFQKAQQRSEMASEEGAYLKMDKGGVWMYGSEEIEVEDGSLWAINPATMSTGFAAWDDDGGGKMGEEMASILSDDIVLRNQLPDVGAPWKPQTGMQLKCMDGEDKDVEVLYATTSKGGTKAFKVIVSAITARIQSGKAGVVPVVQLCSDSYKHKKYGKIYTPELKVVDWLGMDALPETAADEPKPEPEPEFEEVDEDDAPPPARRSTRRAKPEADAPDEDEGEEGAKPTRRRQRQRK